MLVDDFVKNLIRPLCQLGVKSDALVVAERKDAGKRFERVAN